MPKGWKGLFPSWLSPDTPCPRRRSKYAHRVAHPAPSRELFADLHPSKKHARACKLPTTQVQGEGKPKSRQLAWAAASSYACPLSRLLSPDSWHMRTLGSARLSLSFSNILHALRYRRRADFRAVITGPAASTSTNGASTKSSPRSAEISTRLPTAGVFTHEYQYHCTERAHQKAWSMAHGPEHRSDCGLIGFSWSIAMSPWWPKSRETHNLCASRE